MHINVYHHVCGTQEYQSLTGNVEGIYVSYLEQYLADDVALGLHSSVYCVFAVMLRCKVCRLLRRNNSANLYRHCISRQRVPAATAQYWQHLDLCRAWAGSR